MQWITALLAFATTMLFFAIVVSMLVEMIHRALRLRERGLVAMLKQYFGRVLSNAKGVTISGDADSFAKSIAENRAVDTKTTWFSGLLNSSRLKEVPVELFMQKLAELNIVPQQQTMPDPAVPPGAADPAVPAGALDQNAHLDTLSKDLAQKYVAFGKEMSVHFERRARLFSVVISFLVAWVFYVHPYDLAVAYLKTPELAQDVAAMSETLTAKVEQMRSADKQVDNGATTQTDGLDEIKKTLDEIKEQSTGLANLGVPIGWPEKPTESCAFSTKEAANLAAVNKQQAATQVPSTVDDKSGSFCVMAAKFLWFGPPVIWPSTIGLFWLVVGGLLVGLGAPWWARAVSELTGARKEVAKIAEIVGNVLPAGATIVQSGTHPENAAVNAFKISRAASNVAKT